MAEPAKPEGFAVHDVAVTDSPDGNWVPADPLWTEWIKANCRSRLDVIRTLRRVAPVESTAVMHVGFTDTDGRRYGIAIHVGTWYQITRFEWDDRPDWQFYDQGEYTSFGPHDRGLQTWTGEGHA